MTFAEDYATPLDGELYPLFKRYNVFKEYFYLRPGRIRFHVWASVYDNLKVILKVYRSDGLCEQFIVDTDCCDVEWNHYKRITREFYIHPRPLGLGKITCVKFAYIVHLGERSIPSRDEYIFMDHTHLENGCRQWRTITNLWATRNSYRTQETDSGILQRDVDWYNRHLGALRLMPKFTRGMHRHPFHPKRFIHDQIDLLISKERQQPSRQRTIKVCVDCIDDTDFVNHLLFAHDCGITIQCIVDWRKMTLTNSHNYYRLKRSGIDLLGVFCSSSDHLAEVTPDMHNKFIIFDRESAIFGSFNISFDIWGANWESGATFHSEGVCRILDNFFQSIRGGVVQPYGIDPDSHFNLLYTFGRHKMMSGYNYRPHQAILTAIHKARRSIRACLFLLGELQGDHCDSVVDALIQARNRGVELNLIFNGHMARVGDAGEEYSMTEELHRPLLPAVCRLRQAGIPIALAYGVIDQKVPYSPIHSKYCIIDDYMVLDGSFNWYNTSVFSHDLLMVVSCSRTATLYNHEFHDTLRSMRIYWC